MKTLKLTLLIAIALTATITAKAQSAKGTLELNSVITGYMDVKAALFADDGKTAEAKAKTLNAQILAIMPNDLSAPQLDIWKKYGDKLNFDSRHISETDAIDHQREHFESLSKNMYMVFKALNVNINTLYWEYCPMKKTNWLNDKPAVENPYYGKMMPDCGSVKETLNAVK